ncbi:uncharacterized protein [Euphorbia lathyris]|uniref:uncharacterized protein n=1 Tax=Euphorbia lathyris TaxID=212925 RepID=UPI003313A8A5
MGEAFSIWDEGKRNSCVTLIYEAKFAESYRNVLVTWKKSVENYSLSISVENPLNETRCKIDMRGKKGLKSLEMGEKRVEVFWDFREAKFSENPEPWSKYYVAIVQEEEVVLVVGDMKKEALKRTKKREGMEEAKLLCKKEYIYGKKVLSTKVMVDKKEHEVVIELSCGIGEPELSISIDSYEVIHVMNLNWRFRGNENVNITNNGQLQVQVYWDVHDWLFAPASASGTTGNALFIFKEMEKNTFHNNNRTGLWFDHSPLDSTPAFFHVIYASKFD